LHTHRRIKGIFAAGVTGGHIYPALAVAKEIEKIASLEALFVGAGRGAEPRIFKDFPYKYKIIHARGSDVGKISYIYHNALAFLQAILIIQKLKPDFVFTTGGYIGGIVGYAAHLLKVPLFLHESNVSAGISNKKLSKYTLIEFCSFKSTLHEFPHAVLTGMPIREGFSLQRDENFRTDFSIDEGAKVILAFGGSEGADVIDKIVDEIANEMADYIFFHIGKSKIKASNIVHFDYFDDIAYIMRNADAVISRAGASTVAEIIASSTPAILIPWKGALNSHQELNARYLEKAGGAFVVDENNFSLEKIIYLLEKIVDPNIGLKMSKSLEQLNSSGFSAEVIARTIVRIKS